MKVPVSTLDPGTMFRTCLTRRDGVVMSKRNSDGYTVVTTVIQGPKGDVKRCLHPEVIVEIDE